MMSSFCNVKKSVSIPKSFSDQNCKLIADNIYYEEAWELRMARLGIDIAKLNSIFADTVLSNNKEFESVNMTRSCVEPNKRQDPPIIRMTSSAIESSVIANNPVYSFKPCDSAPKSAVADTSDKCESLLTNCTSDDTVTKYHPEMTAPFHNDHIGNIATLRPRLSRGLLLNNNCYEITSSQLVTAIIDKDRECTNSRLFSSTAPSAFKPLSSSKTRPTNSTAMYNNHCYKSLPVSTFSGPTLRSNMVYNRQISAPADSASEIIKKMAYPDDLKMTSKTLQSKASKRSTKSSNCTNHVNISSLAPDTWTLKSRIQVDQHLHESSRISGKLLSKYTTATDESRLSDNYIKHLTGQEIAGNFIKQSQRPECHIQRTEDRYHMGFNDSRLDMIADSNRPLEEHLWYHPFLSRVAAEQLLAKYPEGSFLVRKSESSANEYSLSIRYKQKWLHMKISRDVDGQFVLGQYSQPYPSVPIMIRHYSCSFLPVKGANLISLQQPVFRY